MQLAEIVDIHDRNLTIVQEQLGYVEELVQDGMLTLTIEEFDPCRELSLYGATQSEPHPVRNRESETHVRLKAAAAQYFRETDSEPVFEQPSWFGIADVGVEGGRRFAECGDIRAGKFIEAFGKESSISLLGRVNPAYGVATEFVYLPYTTNQSIPPFTLISITRK